MKVQKFFVYFSLVFIFFFFSCEKEKKKNGDDILIQDVKEWTKPFSTPHYVLSYGGYIFVTNPDISYGENFQTNYGDGFITILREDTLGVINIIKTTGKNPTHISAFKNEIYVVNTGEYYWDNEKNLMFPKTSGGIDIFNLNEIEYLKKPSFHISIPISKNNPLVGAPGGIAIIKLTNPSRIYAYIGSGTAGVLFKVDLENKKLLRGEENPIEVVTKKGNQMTYPLPYPENFISILNFNTDEIYFLDPVNDTLNPPPFNQPISAGKTSDMEGPIHAAFRDDKKYPDLFVLMSISNSITSVDTRYAPSEGINPDFAVTGVAPNRIYFNQGKIFVVNSLSNNVQLIDLENNINLNPFITLPEKSNPYDISISYRKGKLTGYITSLMTNSLVVVDLENGKEIATIK